MYELTCIYCGKQFQSRYKDVKICNECKNRPCEICGKPFLHAWPYDQHTCSAECRRILCADPEYISRREAAKRASVMDKYGVDNVSRLDSVRKKISESHKSEEYKRKVQKTSLEKYGVPYYIQAPEVVTKSQQTIQQRYGVSNAAKNDEIRRLISERLQDPEVRQHYMQTSIEHYGFYPPGKSEEVQAKARATTMEHFGVPYYVMHPEYRSAQATKQISIPNKLFAQILQDQYNVSTEFEFAIERKLYDLHVLDSNVLIEIDPSYTHSIVPNHWCDGLSMDYHLNKTDLAKEHGYRCIHVFDWDNMDVIARMLQPKEVIYARKCRLVKLSAQQAKEFIDANHLQRDARGAKFCYGLTYNDELVCAMTFGKPRYTNKYEWELLRLCSLPGKFVVGGASRMFKQFLTDAHPQSIISYCDLAKFSGDVYSRLGFKLDHISAPSKVWSKGDKKITDNLLRQRGYDQLFNTDYGKGTSNEQLMLDNGWLPVYDCGQAVYVCRA